MLSKNRESDLVFPHAAAPKPGEAIEVARGILWVRLPLPFRLDHVNVYLVADDRGFAVIDTGLGNARCKEAWEAVFAGPLAGQPLTRLIVTHFHPDHVGLAGWFAERFGLPLYMSQTDYVMSLNLHLDPGALDAEPYRQFYLRHGLDAGTTGRVVTQGHGYLKMLTGLPPTFIRLIAGETLRIGQREFAVSTGGGHAPEQLMFFCAAENLFLSADQVLAFISPNVSVWAVDPEGDPLAIYLRSLDSLMELPADALVLPGHQLPFRGLHVRIDELKQHHAVRCAAIVNACRDAPKSAAEIVPVLFHRLLDPHQMGFAFSEVLAHVNYLVRLGRLNGEPGRDGVMRYTAAAN